MNRSGASLVLSVLVLTACSSKTETTEEAAAASADPVAAHQPQANNPAVQSDITALEADLAAKNYEAAFNKIQLLNEVPKSKAEAEQLRGIVSQASDQLYQQAQTDPRAMERYQQLSRIQMGR